MGRHRGKAEGKGTSWELPLGGLEHALEEDTVKLQRLERQIDQGLARLRARCPRHTAGVAFKAVVLILHLPLDSTTVRPLFRSPGPRLGSAYGCEFGSSLGHSPPHQPGVVLGSPLVCVASL